MVLELAQWKITPVSISFMLMFLPLSLFFYYALPAKIRKGSLIIISGAFLLFVVPNQLPLILGVTSATVILCRKMVTLSKSWLKRLCYFAVIILNIGVWFIFGLGGWYPDFPYLLGVGVFPILGIYLASACYESKPHNVPIFSSSLLYLIFYPRLYVGPISTADEFWEHGISTDPAGLNLKTGLENFVRGSFQFLFLGQRLIRLFTEISDMRPQEITRLSSLTMVVALAMGVYHTIAGFMLLSRGIAEMYHIQLPDAFNQPFKAISVYDFVSRFNKPLLTFYEDLYIYKIRDLADNLIINILVILSVGALMGLWYGFNLAFLIFGVLISLFIIIERTLLKKYFAKKPKLSRLYTFITLVFAFALLAIGEAKWNINVVKSLFVPFGITFSNSVIMYLISSNFVILLLSFALITRLPGALSGLFKKLPAKLYEALCAIFHIVLLFILVAVML